METYKLVLPEHLNHYGYLFGGNMLKWVDEYSWIAASLDYPKCTFVTIGMDTVEFRHSVQQGGILRFVIGRIREGKTSVTYETNVFKRDTGQVDEIGVFKTSTTFVNVDVEGNKKLLCSKG